MQLPQWLILTGHSSVVTHTLIYPCFLLFFFCASLHFISHRYRLRRWQTNKSLLCGPEFNFHMLMNNFQISNSVKREAYFLSRRNDNDCRSLSLSLSLCLCCCCCLSGRTSTFLPLSPFLVHSHNKLCQQKKYCPYYAELYRAESNSSPRFVYCIFARSCHALPRPICPHISTPLSLIPSSPPLTSTLAEISPLKSFS